MYGSSRRLLMQEYVQKFTSTTFPRSVLPVRGGELSHSMAPSKSGSRPSSPIPDAIAITTKIKTAAPIQWVRFFMSELRNERPLGVLGLCDSGCDHVIGHFDIALGRQRVRARLARGFHQRLGGLLIHAGEADIQPGCQTVNALRQAKVDLGIDRNIIGQRDPLLPGH